MAAAIDSFALTWGGHFWNAVIVLACVLGVLYGITNKFAQFKLFPEAIRLVIRQIKGGKDTNGVSGFQAFCVTLGGCIGTGNVAGVAMAVLAGGPGVVPWMWLIALLGAGTSLAENTLAQVYKVREGDVFRGGPMYYISKGLGYKLWGKWFSLVMIGALGFALVGLQTNTITLSVEEGFGISVYISAAIVAVLIALIIFGGIKRIADVAEKGVPIMTLLYVIMLVMVLVINAKSIPATFALIFREAVSARAVTGAAFYAIFFNGIKRGVFSSGAGHGDAPTTGAAADVKHPVQQGIFGTLAIYMDTCVVCTASALVIIISGSYIGVDKIGIQLTQYSFVSMLGQWSSVVFAICICMFCFTSIMANYYCGETSLTFLTNGSMKGRNLYRALFVLIVFLGGVTEATVMWDVADMFLAIMLLTNMVALLFFSKQVAAVTNDYIKQRKAGKEEPVFIATEIKEIKASECECWK